MAPEGRTYVDYRWDVREGAEAHFDLHHMQWVYDKCDVTEVTTPHVVPNGKWVMEWPRGYAFAQVVGVPYDSLTPLAYTDAHRVRRTLFISDKPFAYVTTEEEDVDKSVYPYVVKSNARKTLHAARQIHKGELGRSTPTPPLDYVRQPFSEGQKPSVTKAHERRRGYGWVKLAHLGELTVGYNPDKCVELILGYWQFSGHLHYDENGRRAGTLVDTAWGSSLDIRLNEAEFVSMTPEQFRHEADEDTSELWIRRGFAFTILRLQALGVKPAALRTA